MSIDLAVRNAATDDYTKRGWTITETARGTSLVADQTVSGIELTGKLADGVRRYLRANNLTGPIIYIAGPERREIHLVTGLKAHAALAALRTMGATLYLDGALIPLPTLHTGTIRWAVAPGEARWTLPVVAISAAARAAGSRVAAARLAS